MSCGSLPFLRTGTKPARRWYATGAARMKPRASMPTTLSIVRWGVLVDERVDHGGERAGVG